MVDFPKNEGFSRKLKKVQTSVQHFSEQLRHFVPKQQFVRTDESLINYEEGKREAEKTVQFLQIWNKRLRKSSVCNEMCFGPMCWAILENVPYKKVIIDKCIYFSYFTHDWYRHLLLIQKKNNKSVYIIFYCLSSHCPRLVPDVLKQNYLLNCKTRVSSSFRIYILV